MGIVLKTAADPVQVLAILSVEDVKKELRIRYDVEDELIEKKILAAYDWLAGPNGWLNRPLLSSTWTYTGTEFADPITMPVIPLISVSSIKYWTGGVLTTLAPSVYDVDRDLGNIYLKSGQSWPTELDDVPDSVEIEFIAGAGLGTGADIKALHPAIPEALSKLACDYFRHREDTAADSRVSDVNKAVVNDVKRIAGRYKLYRALA